ncbi:DNA-directed RNA polymerase sigma-70 factor [Prolixibacter bellariivorans]|uniref:DNA-directed RNA polymerase sigma-70 factor n=1 Tax=Prolixibacter bellariivorans TaxID=314319 RepID=A0A5M4AU08_9BACT|nr:RNA polymerase sigma-70 factor [Prolixibacter bellariivorans]GET31392.1 DNA-directed RNA polymerase sigma-70 factor [Prolixibacter bellariivorans]
MKIEDKILLNEIRKRNSKVFEALFRDYYPGLVRFAGKFVFDKTISEDIVQNFFAYLWESGRHLNVQTSIRSYFYQSIRNRCLNHLRDLKVKDKHNLLFLEASLSCDDQLFLQDDEIVDCIQQAIESLPKEMLDIFKLKYLKGLDIKEIANIKRISPNTIKTQLLRARKKLKRKLSESTSINFFL